jgi:prepilin-type N-terminal cleavage/methylation domain
MRKKSAAAFTLIELLLVVMILGVIVAIAVPRVGPMVSGGSLRMGAREFAAVCKYARTMALLNQTPVDVTFTQGGAEVKVAAQEIREASGLGMSDLAALTNSTGYTEALLDTSARRRASLSGGFGIAMSREAREDAEWKGGGAESTNTMSILEEQTGGEVAATVSFADSINLTRKMENARLFFDEYADRVESRSAYSRIAGTRQSFSEGDAVAIRFRANGTARPCRVKVANADDEADFLTVAISQVGSVKIISEDDK